MPSRPSIFISYKRENKAEARRIKSYLASHDYDVFLDLDNIDPGQKWPEEITRSIAACDCFVIVLGEHTLESPEVRRELREALGREKTIIPIRLATFSWEHPIPEDVDAIRRYTDIAYVEQDNRELEQIAEAVDLAVLGSNNPDEPQNLMRLEHRLREKYRRQRTTFSVVPFRAGNKESFYYRTAQVFLDEINGLLASRQYTDVVVGVVCGPTLRGVVRYFWANPPQIEPSLCRRLKFVSLNTAGYNDKYHLSGNYLAVSLSEIFEGASHYVELGNSEERDRRSSRPNRFDLLFCSAGDRDGGFLIDWLRERGNEFPPAAIGDFCLSPIDAGGASVGGAALRAQLQELSPRPAFENLEEIAGIFQRVLFPITGQPRQHFQRSLPAGSQNPITDKETVARTVLESGIISRCILDRALAEDILWNTNSVLCGYRLLAVAEERPAAITYQAQRLADEEQVSVRVLHAPQMQIRQRTPGDAIDLPVDREIIISDPVAPAEQDEEQERQFPVSVDDVVKEIYLRPGVRKPGYWSLVTLRVVQQALQNLKRTGLRVLDLGCGSGIIGLVLNRDPSVSHVSFYDIDEDACTSVSINLPYWKREDVTVDLRISDLFTAVPTGECFDVVVFTPPFYPEFIHTVNQRTDIGGKTGLELAQRFAEQVAQYLTPTGVSVMYLPDYVNSRHPVQAVFRRARLTVRVEERDILYPFEPRHNFPQCNEILHRSELETFYDYRFAEYKFDNRRFLGFKMMHFIASHTLSPGR